MEEEIAIPVEDTEEEIAIPVEDTEEEIAIPVEDTEEEEVAIVQEEEELATYDLATDQEEEVDPARQAEWQVWLTAKDRENANLRKLRKDEFLFPRLPDNKGAARALALAEKKLDEKRAALDEVKRYEAGIRAQLAGVPEKEQDVIVQEKLKEFVSSRYTLGGYGDVIARLWQDTKETTSPRDEYKAMIGDKEYPSPLQFIETAFSNPLDPSKWSATVKNPREKLERIVNSDLIRQDGSVNLEAIFHSDMPREWQNQFMAYEAARQTGLPTEIWNDIVEGRYGSLPSEEGGTSAPKRVAQMLDAVVLNAYSNKLGGVDAKIDMLKRITPPYNVAVKRDNGGALVFDMPGTTADGMATDYQGDDPTSPDAQKQLWADFVGYSASMVQDESLSNLADVASMMTELGISIIIPPAAGAVAGARAAKLAAVARRAEKAAHVSRMTKLVNLGVKGAEATPGVLGMAYRAIQGDIPVIATMAKMTPRGRKLAYTVIKNNPRLAGIANAADRLGTIAATHATLGYMGAGEKSKEQAAIGAALFSVPLNISMAVKDSFHYNVLTKYPKAFKQIERATSYDQLSDFSKRLVDSSGMSWDQVKAQNKLFRDNAQLMLDVALRLEQGIISDRNVPEIVDAISRDAGFRKFADEASRATTEDLGVAGRFNKLVVEELVKQLDSFSRDIAGQSGTVASRGTASVDQGAINKLGMQRLKKRIDAISNDVWSDVTKLFAAFDADPYIKPYAIELKNRIEDRGFGRDLAYNRMASQMLQAGIIIRGAKEQGDNALRLLREYSSILANPGPDIKRLRRIQDVERHSSDVTGFVKVADNSDLGYHFELRTTKLPKIAPQPTVRNILANPDAINDILDATNDVLRDYTELGIAYRGSGAPKLSRGVRERIKLLTKREKDFLHETTSSIADSDARIKNLRERASVAWGKARSSLAQANALVKKYGLADQDIMAIHKVFKRRNPPKKKVKELLEKYPKDLINAVRNIGRWKTKNVQINADLAKAIIRNDEVRHFTDTKGSDFIERAKQFSPSDKYWKDLGMPNIEGMENHPYWQSLSNKIAYDFVKGIEDTGVPTANIETLRMLRALERPEFVLDLVPGMSRAEVDLVGEQARLLALAVHRQTGVGRIMRNRIKKIEDELAGITDTKAKRAAALAWMKEVRKSYKGIYSLRSFVSKYEDRLRKLSDTIFEGETIGAADMKLLYTLTKSSSMATYRLRAEHPQWVVPLSQEAMSVYAAIEQAGEKAFNIFLDKARLDNPTLTDADAAVLAGRFLGITRHADATGFLGAAVSAARFYRAKESLPEEFDPLLLRELFYTQDNLLNYMSKETALGVDRVVSKYQGALQRAKIFHQRRVAEPYMKELMKIPGYLTTDYGTDLSKLLHYFSGFGDQYEWPLVGGQRTEFGDLLWKVMVERQDLDKLFSGLESEALKLSDTYRPGPRSQRFQMTERDLRLDELRRWKESIKYYWGAEVKDPKVWKIAFEVQRISQVWDKKAVEIYNQLTDNLNKEWGTKYAHIQYQPYRLDGHMRAELDRQVENIGANAMQTMGLSQAGRQGAYDALMGSRLLGRNIETSKGGQRHKISTLTFNDVDDVRNNFLLSKELLFTHAYTRDALVELRELGIKLKDGGYENHANAVARTALRHYANIAPSGTRRIIQNLANTGGLPSFLMTPARIAGAAINPYQMLSTVYKTAVDNPAQGIVMMAGSSANTLLRVPTDSAKFLLQYPIRTVFRDFSISSPNEKLQMMGFYGDIPPEAIRAAREYTLSAQKVEYGAFERGKTMINWNTTPRSRVAYWWSGKVGNDFFSEQIYKSLKENSEILVKDIVVGHTMNSYVKAVAFASKAKELPLQQRITGVRDILAENLRGVGVAADVTDLAVTLVRDVENEAPYRGLTGYLFQTDAAMIGRFDPQNVAPLVTAIDRAVPGVANFFNPIYGPTFRLAKLISNVIQGSKSESAFVALVGIAAWMGISYMLKSMQEMNEDGTEGTGPMKLAVRLDPLQVIRGVVDGTVAGVKTPSIRVGGMEARFWYEFLYRAGTIASTLNIRDQHPDRAYEAQQANDKEILSMLGLLESSTPLAVLQEFVGSPISVGWHYFAMDREEVKAKILKEMRSDPAIKGAISPEGVITQPLTSDQMRVVDTVDLLTSFLEMAMPVGSEDINPVPDEKWYKAQSAFRLALGKLGIGADNKLMYAFATDNRARVEQLLGIYKEMNTQGAGPFPAKEPGTGGVYYEEPEQ